MSRSVSTREPCDTPLRPPERVRTVDFIWLCYSIYFFAVPAQQPSSFAVWLTAALLFLCFLALYVSLVFTRRLRTKRLLLAALALLGLAYYPFNPGAGVVFIYCAAFAPLVAESIPIVIALIVASAAASAVEGLALHFSAWIWGIFAFFSFPAGIGNLIWTLHARSRTRLGLAQEQIEHLAQVAERERIARDLHDVLGHTLSLIVLKSELAGRLLHSNPQQAQREISEVEQSARTALGEVRETIRGYRSEGLAAELARARATLALAGVSLECAEPLPRVEPIAESVLALVLRESVTNIVRHARATRCRLILSVDPRGTALRIEDDGRGGIEHEGNGLRGMRERLATLGGRLAIDSRGGTRLTAEIPAPAAVARAQPA
ncbi:MAG: sensor histidine kinase [Steroidobacteraceae bacterium]